MRPLALAVTLAVALTAPAALAQTEPEPEDVAQADRAVARSHYNRGVEHASAGRWEPARLEFQRAADIAAFAAILFNLAAAQAHTGMLVEAAENYRAFLRRRRSTESDLIELRTDAQRDLQEVLTRVGRLTLRINNVDERDDVQLDERSLSHALLDTPMPINPGPHTIRVLRGETLLADRPFSVAEAEPLTIEMSVTARTAQDDSAAAIIGTDTTTRPTEDLTWLWATIAAGSAAVAILVVIGIAVAASGGGQAPYAGNLGEPVRLPLTLASF